MINNPHSASCLCSKLNLSSEPPSPALPAKFEEIKLGSARSYGLTTVTVCNSDLDLRTPELS